MKNETYEKYEKYEAANKQKYQQQHYGVISVLCKYFINILNACLGLHKTQPRRFLEQYNFQKNHVFLKMRQFGKKKPPKSLMIQNGLLLEQQQLEGKIRVCIRTSQRKGVMAELSKPVERKGAMCVVLV